MRKSLKTDEINIDSPAIYRIRVQGIIPPDWSFRLNNMQITANSDGKKADETLLVGKLNDQAALTGVLNTLYNNQFPVLSVECLEKL